MCFLDQDQMSKRIMRIKATMYVRNLFAYIIRLTTSSSSPISHFLVDILVAKMLIVLYRSIHIYINKYIYIYSLSQTIILNKHA